LARIQPRSSQLPLLAADADQRVQCRATQGSLELSASGPCTSTDGAKAKAKGKGGAAADTTPEHAKACEDLWDRSGGFFSAGPFTPFLLQREGVPPRSTIIFPGAGGMATDQQRGIVFAYSQDQAQVGWTEKKKPGVTYAFDEAKSNFPTLAQASMVRVRSIPSARPQAETWANSHVRNRRGAG
jgi:hypothetical protein